MTKVKKWTNKQNIVPNRLVHHHEQGLTCDCKQCGTEFKQYHNEHVFCSEQCQWTYNGVETTIKTCSRCKKQDPRPVTRSLGYKCTSCRKLSMNPQRTDVIDRKVS